RPFRYRAAVRTSFLRTAKALARIMPGFPLSTSQSYDLRRSEGKTRGARFRLCCESLRWLPIRLSAGSQLRHKRLLLRRSCGSQEERQFRWPIVRELAPRVVQRQPNRGCGKAHRAAKLRVSSAKHARFLGADACQRKVSSPASRLRRAGSLSAARFLRKTGIRGRAHLPKRRRIRGSRE